MYGRCSNLELGVEGAGTELRTTEFLEHGKCVGRGEVYDWKDRRRQVNVVEERKL